MIDLIYYDDVSVLMFQNYKESAEACFCNSADISVDALKILNFLIKMNYLHIYDEIMTDIIT